MPPGIQHGVNALEELYQPLITIINVDPLGKREPVDDEVQRQRQSGLETTNAITTS
jgi:hypothetical protein